MAATPEIPRPQDINEVSETQEEFIVPEVLQQSTGVQVVQKNFKAQVNDDSNKPIIQTPPTQVISVSPPYPQTTLVNNSKGKITDGLTWLAVFWIRILKKAAHFGWQVIGKE